MLSRGRSRLARRLPPRRPGASFTGLVGLALCTLALTTCNWVDPFDGYYDSTVNFIEASGLSETTIDRTTAGYQNPAAWTWAWRGADDADDATGFDYMTLVDTGTIGAAEASGGLLEGSPIYRLTLVNLVSDGDFEADDAAPTGYNIDPAVWHTDADSVLIEDVGSINGYSAKIATEPNEYVHFALSTFKDSSGASAHDYRLIANSANDNDACYYQVGTFGVPVSESTGLPSLNAGAFNLILQGIRGIDNRALIVGSGSLGEITVDDLRAHRNDISARLRLLLRRGDTNPRLANGYYEFTIWARKPAGLFFANQSGAQAPDADDAYAAEFVSLYMTNLTGKQGSDQEIYSIPDDTAWHRFVLRQEANFDGLEIKSAEALVELAIAPFSDANPEPGSVEIAQPELHFYLNGYGGR
jgi:hypothetical protein